MQQSPFLLEAQLTCLLQRFLLYFQELQFQKLNGLGLIHRLFFRYMSDHYQHFCIGHGQLQQ